MSSQTKIIVLNQKKLIYGALIILACIVLIIFLMMLPNKEAPSTPDDNTFQYTAGVYSSTVVLNGNPVEICVTIDENLIHHIETRNVSDAIETNFPLFQSSFEDISSQVISNNSTHNVTYSSENKYTGTILLEAIESALSKSRPN